MIIRLPTLHTHRQYLRRQAFRIAGGVETATIARTERELLAHHGRIGTPPNEAFADVAQSLSAVIAMVKTIQTVPLSAPDEIQRGGAA